MRFTIPAAAFAVTGAAVLFALPAVLRAADESARDAVERLMPQLLSDDDIVRADAEKALFQLGDAGRAELERVTRDTDPRRAVAALRLLQSSKWSRTAKGERRVEPVDGSQPRTGQTERMEDLRVQMERQLEEVRKRMEQWDQSFTMRMPPFDASGAALTPGSSGSIVENDRSTQWSVGEDGRIKVTLKDGSDAPEQKFEAKDLDELKKDHPDVAKRIEPLLGRTRTFVLRPGSGQSLELFDGQNGLRRRALPLQPEALQPPVLGITWAPVPDVLRDQVELPPGGVVVEAVVKDSLAEKLGLARHDVLVDLMGKPVSGADDVHAALDDVKAGEKVTATVVRKGAQRVLETVK